MPQDHYKSFQWKQNQPAALHCNGFEHPSFCHSLDGQWWIFWRRWIHSIVSIYFTHFIVSIFTFHAADSTRMKMHGIKSSEYFMLHLLGMKSLTMFCSTMPSQWICRWYNRGVSETGWLLSRMVYAILIQHWRNLNVWRLHQRYAMIS